MSSTVSEQLFRFTAVLFLASIPFDIPNRPIPVDVPSITAALMLAAAIYHRRFVWALPAAFWLFGGWLYIGILATLYQGAHHLSQSGALLLQILEPLLVMAVVYDAGRDRKTLRSMLWAIIIGCTIRAGLQLAGVGTTSLGRWATEERLTAWGENPNNASANLAVGLLILVALGFARQRGWTVRIAAAGAGAVICAAIVQMGSRGAILGLIAGLLAGSVVPSGQSRSSVRRLLLSFTVAGALIAMCYFSPSTRGRFEETIDSGQMSGREELYPTLYAMFKEHPLFGWGLAESQYELAKRTPHASANFERRDSHDLYLEIATSTGLCGLLPFSFGLIACIKSAWRARLGADGTLAIALLICTLVVNITQDWLLSKLFWAVLGYVLAAGALTVKATGRSQSKVWVHEQLCPALIGVRKPL